MSPGSSRRRAGFARHLGPFALGCLVGLGATTAEALSVVSVSPPAHALRASTRANITIEFDRPVARASVTPETCWAFGRWSGTASGALRFSNGDRTVTLDPDRRFSAGETVLVVLSRNLQGADGSFLRSGGYSFQFWTRSQGSAFDFDEVGRFSTRTDPSVSTRPYGGLGSDVDGDGRLDLTVVNEDTNDLRVYLNRGGSGLSGAALEPHPRVGNVPSPNEPADFDRDGRIDIVVANTRGSSISVLLGHGDGTFAPDQRIPVGGEPRGVTVLDADGDGDLDIATATFSDGRVTILVNDGGGRFSRGSSFGTGGGERAIAAGDMNDDGMLDLVVGAQTTEEIHVYLNRGDGTFDRGGAASSGGAVWMLVLGDVDRDGAEDVAVVNGRSNSAAIVPGDGEGGLGPPSMTDTDPFPLATDLADLDGDGDLDWVTSSFDGDWLIFANDGRGRFSERRRIAAPEAASCSIPMDFDGDGRLDLALIDEIADEVILMATRAGAGGGGNGGAAGLTSDFESGDASAWSRARGTVEVSSPGLRGSSFALRVGIDGTSAPAFVESKAPRRETSWSVAFDLNVNGANLGGGEIEILRLAAGAPRAILTLSQTGDRYRVHLLARTVDGGYREVGSTSVPASRTVRLGVDWSSATSAASADGSTALFKKDRLRAVRSDLANHGHVVNKVRLGAPSGSPATAEGELVIDNYRSSPTSG